VSKDRTLLRLDPGSNLFAELFLKKNNLESLEVSKVLSFVLVGYLLSQLCVAPFLVKTILVYVVGQLLFLLSSGHSSNSELGELNSLGWDELSFNVGGWSINQNLFIISYHLQN
jgi:hypothetical protein